jgi:hypothetical protein
MGVDPYTLGWLAETRLAEARAYSARQALLRSVRAGRGDVLASVALALIKLGRRLGRRQARGRRGARLAALNAR